MPQQQAIGLLLISVGILSFLLVARHRRRVRTDPLWLWRGELRDLISPSLAPLVNVTLGCAGVLTGTASLAFGLGLLSSL